MEMESTNIAFYCPIDHKPLRLMMNNARKLSFNDSFKIILEVYRLGTSGGKIRKLHECWQSIKQKKPGMSSLF